MVFGCAGSDRVGGSGGGAGADAEVEADAPTAPEDLAVEDSGRAGDAPLVRSDAGRDARVEAPDVATDLPRESATDLLRESAADLLELPRDGAADLTRDAAPPKSDVASDIAASPLDTLAPDAPAGGDPEPGRLAGITRYHNQVRAGIPVPDLTWDPGIAATAAAYAARCLFEHSGTSGLGENLAAYAPPGNQAAAGPVSDWADEAQDYSYTSNSCAADKQCGHYTQLVWKSSRRLGCAVQVCDQNSPFTNVVRWELWVCNYSPPGNIVGQRPY
jgi:pathogenesis-related protein 1